MNKNQETERGELTRFLDELQLLKKKDNFRTLPTLVHKYADPDTMFRGEIGKLGNIRFIETSEAKIWKDETCPTGLAVFGTLVLGAHAYGVTELEGGGLEHIVKQLGYGDDPLNQRASVGWKGMRAAERLVEQYMVRIESVSSYSANAAAN